VAVVVLAGLGLSLGHLPARTAPAMAEVVAGTASATPTAQHIRPGSQFRQLPALTISAVGQVGAIEFVGDRLRVEVIVDGVTHRLRLGPEGALVDGLAPGTHTWTARASGHLDASGSVVVPSPAPPPTMPEPTTQASTPASQPTTQLTFDPPIDPDRTD